MTTTELNQLSQQFQPKLEHYTQILQDTQKIKAIFDSEEERQKFFQEITTFRDEILSQVGGVMFASAELAQDLLQDVWALLVRIKDIFFTFLTKLEDDFYREGESKSEIRSLLFVLALKVGELVVPEENNVLDYRKVGKPEESQRGELLEAVHVYTDFLRNKHTNKLWVLEELGDAIFNLSQAAGVAKVINLIAADNPKHREFGFALAQIAEAKFEQRYLYQSGKKNEDREREHVTTKGEDWKLVIEELFDKNAYAIPSFIRQIAQAGEKLLQAHLEGVISNDELATLKEQLVTTQMVDAMLASRAA